MPPRPDPELRLRGRPAVLSEHPSRHHTLGPQAVADFNLVAAHGGFGAASRASGRSKATLSRPVRALEDSVGTRLLERGASALRLTDEGAALHAGTRDLVGEIAEAGEDASASSAHPSGRLRVSRRSCFLTSRWAAEVVAAYPDVRLEVTVEDRFVEVVGEGYDVVIRISPSDDTRLVGRLFLKDRMMGLSTTGPPLQRTDSGATEVPAVVLTTAPDRSIWRHSAGDREIVVASTPVSRLPSLPTIRDAVLRAAGAAMLPASIVHERLAAGSLVAWGPTADRAVEVWVLPTAQRLASPEVSAFVGFLCSAFAHGSL